MAKDKKNGFYGKHHTDDAKRRIKESRLERKKALGYLNSPKTRTKLREANKGHKVSEKTRQKIKEANKGQHRSEETKKRIKEALIGKCLGKDNSNWKGGLSFEPYTVDWTETLKRSIRERDHYICQLCSGEGYPVHHIDYNKKNCNPDNLITLCVNCNSKVNFDRNYWENYFEARER